MKFSHSKVENTLPFKKIRESIVTSTELKLAILAKLNNSLKLTSLYLNVMSLLRLNKIHLVEDEYGFDCKFFCRSCS